MPNKNEIQNLIIIEDKDLVLIYSTEAEFAVYFEDNNYVFLWLLSTAFIRVLVTNKLRQDQSS